MITMRNVILVAIYVVLFHSTFGYAKEIAGEIVSVSGTVFIRPDHTVGAMPSSPPKAKPGDNVFAGDVINTSSEGAVKILMRDKTIVDIGASTLFKMDEYIHNNGANRKAKLDMMFGKMRVSVTKKIEGEGKFQVKTKGATMGVRGTEFIIKEDIPDTLSKKDKSAQADSPKTQKTEVTVVQGKVDVTAASAPQVEKKSGEAPRAPETKTVSLTAGTQLTTGAGVTAAEAAPVKVTETQIQALKVETKIVDNTFSKAVTIDPMSLNDTNNSNRSGESSGDQSRNPASGSSSGRGSSAPAETPLFNNIVAAVNVGLPPVVTGPPPVIDVPGVPVNPFQNVGLKNNMKNIHVTIVLGGAGGGNPP